MGPRGRGGNFRGRGSRGGRGGAGRGRGRGKGTSRYGPNRRFDGQRLAENDGDEDSKSDELSGDSDDESLIDSNASDDEEEDVNQKAVVRPYTALLQGFNDDNAPSAKRRKTDHRSTAETSQQDSSSEDESPVNDEVDAQDEPEDDIEEQSEDSGDEEENSNDPFDTHFAHPDETQIAKRVQALKAGQLTTKRAMVGPWRATFQTPGAGAGADGASDIPQSAAGLDSFNLKQKLKEIAARKITDFGDVEKSLGSLLFNYHDVLHCDRTVKNSQAMRKIVCLHALNHVFKTRDRVIKHNYKLHKDGDKEELDLRDQGFTRPKVLFILPTRNSCAQVVNTIRDLCEPEQQENRKRFEEGFIDKDNSFGHDRPADFKDLFEGNDDDMFRLGMKFTRKTVKYFSQFYNSDILFASPLGLRMAIGSDEEKKKKVEYDFLSSIEMVIVDQADALLMQNWEHVEYIFEHLNLQPKDAHDCDFSRVRSWYLEDWAKYFRQTIVLSAFNTPELAELLRLHGQNWAGKVRLQLECPGVLQQLGIKMKQTFSRFQSPSVDKDPDARFNYFTTALVPSLVKRSKDATGTLIFIPSYLDFVRVRNYFANSPDVSSITFGAISEYADVPEASRARSHFLNGRHRVLLYTERAHHFRRYQLRGVQRVIFYGLPDNPIFYKEIAGGYLGKSEEDMRLETGMGSVRVMFSKYDVMKLDRIAGSKRVGKMMQEKGDTFDFV